MGQLNPKMPWMLDKSGLDSLLHALHPDREQASHAYEDLRRRLIRFFKWNHADLPEDLADETLDRLARRLCSPQETILEPLKFASGIARLVLKEHWRNTHRREEALVELLQEGMEKARREQERRDQQECAAVLERCLDAIPEPSRTLVQRYFSSESRAHIQQRQKLAQEYGISLNALRNRVMRIRKELEKNYLLMLAGKVFPGDEMDHSKLSHYDE